MQPIHHLEELYVGDLTLVLGTPITDPLPEGTPVTYVGPLLWQDEQAQPPLWFEELVPGCPVIWIYVGNLRYLPIPTPIDTAYVLDACIKALAGEDFQVVVSAGNQTGYEKRNLPVNFRLEAYVPGMLMARRANLLIHHGGYGSCQTGLTCGTPAVIIPTYTERESNARRVRDAGAGEIVLPRRGHFPWQRTIDIDELRQRINQVLGDPRYRECTHQISEQMKEYGGAALAADLIEKLVNA